MERSSRKRILLAVDGSEAALDAVSYVSRTVPPLPVEVVLFHVTTKVPESFWDLEKEPAFHYKIASVKAWETQQEKMIQAFMDRARGTLVGAGIPEDAVTIAIQPRKAGIARDIIEESRKGYDAVVVARRGLSQLKDLVIGSIAEKLVGKLVDVPVWLVGSGSQSRKVLVSVDASEGAMQAVEYVGRMLGGGADVQVLLFHAIRGLNVFMQGFGDSFVMNYELDWVERVEQELQETQREVEPALQEAKRRLVAAGFEPSRVTEKIVKGVNSRAGAIVEEAQQGGYDTIVVGRRGLSKVQEFFMGRVSNKVIHLAAKKAVWVVS